MSKLSTERAIDALDTVRAYYASLTAGYPKGKDCKGIGDVTCVEIANSCLMAIKALEQEPQTDEIILSKKEYRELLSDEFEHGYDKGLSDAITSLEQEPCEDAISREEVIQSRPEWLSEDVERDTDVQTVVDRAFNRGWNYCLKEFLKNIKELPSITPQQRVGRWINKYAEDACGERYSYWACSECGRDVGFNLTNIEDVLSDYPYCHCGAKMVEPQESEDME